MPGPERALAIRDPEPRRIVVTPDMIEHIPTLEEIKRHMDDYHAGRISFSDFRRIVYGDG